MTGMDEVRARQFALHLRRSLKMIVTWTDHQPEGHRGLAAPIRLSCLIIMAWVEERYRVKGNAAELLRQDGIDIRTFLEDPP